MSSSKKPYHSCRRNREIFKEYQKILEAYGDNARKIGKMIIYSEVGETPWIDLTVDRVRVIISEELKLNSNDRMIAELENKEA